jgi:hypothetical protein
MDHWGWDYLLAILATATWDGIKHFCRTMLWAAMMTTLAGIVLGIVRRMRHGASDLWVLGTIFFVSAAGLYLMAGGGTPVVPLSSMPPSSSVVSQPPVRVDQQAATPAVPVMSEMPPSQKQYSAVRELPAAFHVPAPEAGPGHFVRFTELDHYKLILSFIVVPRPCTVKVTAPLENIDYRRELISMVDRVGLRGLGQEEVLVDFCQVVKDQKDESPELYTDLPPYAPPGTIVVNTASSNAGTGEFIVKALRGTRVDGKPLDVKLGTTLPPDSPEGLIYIQIGTGPLR